MTRLSHIIMILTVLFISTSLRADESDIGDSDWSIESWTFMTSVYTRHFDPEPDHVNQQKLIGAEANFANGWIAGASVFDNSFGQNSQFVYIARSWSIRQSDHWYFKLRGGLLHGYKEPYEDKIPLNGLGVAPVLIPSLGFKYRRFVSEVNIAGTAAVMFTVGLQF